MTQANIELLDDLSAAGVSREGAHAAAESIAAAAEAATKTDLVALEARLTQWMTAPVSGATGAILAAVTVATGWTTSLLMSP